MRKFRVLQPPFPFRQVKRTQIPTCGCQDVFLETRIRVLVSQKLIGAGYRIIQRSRPRIVLFN